MKIAYKHLVRNISPKPNIQDISSKLIQLGHEHEVENDIFDMEFTPNRGDCLSLLGIQRDLNIFYKINNHYPIYDKKIKKFNINFANHEKVACPKISFLKIQISNNIKEYNGVLKDYFKDLEINRNNFFTDISNYISYEMGQPTHCYDASKIRDKIFFKKINEDCLFETLFDKEIKLTGENYVFADKNKIINLAGVVGDKSTSCSPTTREVIIECAYFQPEIIIGKSIKYDVISEASHKFERGVDINNHDLVLRRFLKIVEDHAEIIKVELITESNAKFINKEIEFSSKYINKILGTSIDDKQYKNFLENLFFKVNNDKVIVPSFRSDIAHQNDLAEEVARLIGYDDIPKKEFNIIQNVVSSQSIENNIKSLLIDNGFCEVINFPFVNSSNEKSFTLDNPLYLNKPYLRVDLKESLLNNLIFNERRQKDSIKLFEVSKIYNHSNVNQPKFSLGLIASGRIGKNYINFSKKVEKKYIFDIFKDYISSDYMVINEISNEIKDRKSKDKIFYFEIDLDKVSLDLLDYQPNNKPPENFIQYSQISEFPISNRDLSFLIKDQSSLGKLQDIIFSFNNDILKEIFIFDYYNNHELNQLKIGFRFVFQSNERTMKDEEIDCVMEEIIKSSLEIKNVDIPGLQK